MLYTKTEILDAHFNEFYADNIKDTIAECDGDLQMAEELVEDRWVKAVFIDFPDVKHRDLDEVL